MISLETWETRWADCAKCIITYSHVESVRVLETMGLDQTVWAPRFYFDTSKDKRWDVIVVVQPPDGWKNCHDTWIRENVRSQSDTVVLL